jgi:hypothetical protein
LDLLEMALDFYFVQPARKELKQEAIRQEPATAGSPSK